MEKLLGAKSYDTAIQIQSEFWKTSYASFVAQATKIGELYSSLAKEAFKPVETAVSQGVQRKELGFTGLAGKFLAITRYENSNRPE